MSERTWLYGLTADEWLHLASEGQESEVAPCCGNISSIRETLNVLATCQGDDNIGWQWTFGRELLEEVENDSDEHSLQDREQFPLLHKVLDGVRAQWKEKEEKNLI